MLDASTHDIPSGHNGRGRGSKAVEDMKARLAAMQSRGMDSSQMIDALWSRNAEAVMGGGHVYDMVDA